MGFLFLALFIIAWLLLIIGGIMFIIAAFRVSVVWGLCVLFLGPAAFFFLIFHWEDAKKAFGIQMLGLLIALVAIFSGVGGTTSASMASVFKKLEESGAMEDLAKQLEESGIAEEQLEAFQKMAEGTAGNTINAGNSGAQNVEVKRDAGDPGYLVGESLETVRTTFGRPKGQMRSGDEVCFLYDKFTVFSSDGTTVSRVETGDGKKGKQLGKPRRESSTGTPSTRGSTHAVRAIKEGGKKVDLKQLLVPGKITIIDFYADWCAPCRRLGPKLEEIARTDPDVYLCKVDIVNWKTPVVKQFGIRSIPNVRVYSRNGAPVGNPTSGLSEITANIERAR